MASWCSASAPTDQCCPAWYGCLEVHVGRVHPHEKRLRLALRRLQGIRIVLGAAVVCEAPHTVYVLNGVVVFGIGQAEGRGPLTNERINAMSDSTIGFDQTEEEIILAYEVSD